jgi:tetratricopeptide (TPR) repeat protein
MAKNFKKDPKKTTPVSAKKTIEKIEPVKIINEPTSKPSIFLNKLLQYRAAHQWIIFIFAFLLYSNTISNKYAVDDSIVIERNMYTKKGLKGMAGIWGKDTFVGFFGDERNLVSGGRYRPFTVAMFAIENQLFGKLIRNNNNFTVSTNLQLDVSKKNEVLANLGNPKHTVGEAKVEERNGQKVSIVTVNIEIEKGKPIPDKDGDYVYEGNPHFSHGINAFLFGILCWLLYIWILFMFDPSKNPKSKAVYIAFAAAMLFAAHPLHVEAVANIKGRDEIMVTLFSVLSAHWVMKSLNNKYWVLYMAAAILSFFLGLFSKESAIPFLVVIPAAIFFFSREKDTNKFVLSILLRTAPFLIATLVFWYGVRNPILKWPSKEKPAPELMNDPFMKLVPSAKNERTYVSFSDDEKNAMILHTWADYLKLLAVPYPLTNDYYPKHIGVEEHIVQPKIGSNITAMKNADGSTYYISDDIPQMGSPKVSLSILLHLAMAVLAIYGLIKRKPFAFALIFYAATFSVVSNWFFPIGTLMAERFMFMPSIAFSIISGIGLAYLAFDKEDVPTASRQALPIFIFTVITVLYSFVTFFRNYDWYNDYTLFTKDILVSKNSAKLNNAVSGVIQEKAAKPETSIKEKEELYRKAIIYSENAISIHPTYNGAWLLYGVAHSKLGEIKEAEADSLKKINSPQTGIAYDSTLYFYNKAINSFLEVKKYKPDHQDIKGNFIILYMTRGKLYGEKLNKVPEALSDLEKANEWAEGKDMEILRLMGVAYGISGIMAAQQGNLNSSLDYHTKAVNALEKALKIAPNVVAIIFNLEVAYTEIAKLSPDKAESYKKRAKELNTKWRELDPNYNPAGPQPKPVENNATTVTNK